MGHTLMLVLNEGDPRELALVAAQANSYILDYVARQKLGGTHLNPNFFRQLPFLPHARFADSCPWDERQSLQTWVSVRVLELTFTAWDLSGFAQNLGWDGPPFRWDSERRALLRAELDAAFFHLYSLNRDGTEYVLDTFPIVRRNDEKKYGEYRTKRLILECYDTMAKAIDIREPYQTIADPPPADPLAAHASTVLGH